MYAVCDKGFISEMVFGTKTKIAQKIFGLKTWVFKKTSQLLSCIPYFNQNYNELKMKKKKLYSHFINENKIYDRVKIFDNKIF